MPASVYLQAGDKIDYTPSAAVAAGDVVVLETLIGVAVRPIPASTRGALAVAGVFTMPKATGVGTALTQGETLWWDATSGEVSNDHSAGFPLLGKCAKGAATTDATVEVLLTP